MGELCEAYLGPEYLPEPRIIVEDFLKQGEGYEPSLSPHLAPFIAKILKDNDDVFHLKYEGQDYIIRPLNVKEYKILSKIRQYFDPTIGFPSKRPRFNIINLEDIFSECILYPENIEEMNISAGVTDMLIETAIQHSGWDSEEDVFTSQGYGRSELKSNLIKQIFTFILRAHPGTSQKDLERKNILDIMELLASSELILGDSFDIEKSNKKKDGEKISTDVMIKEDLQEMRKAGIGNNPLEQ